MITKKAISNIKHDYIKRLFLYFDKNIQLIKWSLSEKLEVRKTVRFDLHANLSSRHFIYFQPQVIHWQKRNNVCLIVFFDKFRPWVSSTLKNFITVKSLNVLTPSIINWITNGTIKCFMIFYNCECELCSDRLFWIKPNCKVKFQ